MENIVLITTSPLSRSDLRQLIVELGGDGEGETLVIQRGGGAIYIDHYEISVLRSEYEPDEFVRLQTVLGGEPRAAVSVHEGRSEQSRNLLSEFAREFLQRWGGVGDDNQGRLFGLEELRTR